MHTPGGTKDIGQLGTSFTILLSIRPSASLMFNAAKDNDQL